MHGHRIDSELVAENVRLEVVYESNPSFAGESIQLLIRLRHLGSLRRYEQLEEESKSLEATIAERTQERENENKPWLVKSLLKSFNRDQKAREERETELQKDIEKKMNFHRAVDLMSCYVQIYGLFQYDPDLIDRNELNRVNKLAGVNSLRSSYAVQSISEAVSGFFFTSFDEMANATRGNDPVLENVPILLIPQTLLFSEVCLEPGEVKTYQFKSPKLPCELPPSYRSSKHLKIQYFSNFGITIVNNDTLTSFNTEFPLNVSPFIDSQGYQFTATIDRDLVILSPGRVKEIKDNSKTRRKSGASIIPHRRSSLLSINSAEFQMDTSRKAKEKFKSLVSELNDSEDFKPDIEDLVEQILDAQFGPEKYVSSSDEDDEAASQKENLSKAEYQDSRTQKDSTISVRHNISNFCNLSPTVISSNEGEDNEELSTKDLLPQFKIWQKEYIINRNGIFISKVSFSKFYYDISDDIDLVIELSKGREFKVSAVSATLESFELINPKYTLDGSPAKTKPEGIPVYESRAICFDNSFVVPLKLVPQKSPTNQITSQFRTDIFHFKWMLRLKFVLLENSEDNSTLENFYEDKNGSLSHAKKYLEGDEFMCHIPLVVLPTNKEFGGW